MSVNNTEGNNVLPFKRGIKGTSASPAAMAVTELNEMLIIYDHLIALLRETDNGDLDVLTDSIVGTVVRCRENLTSGIDDVTGPKMAKEMRDGLHQIPGVLRSILPGLGARLGESIERKLGVQFSKY
ncbi:hypothetical protein [Herminiimonas fonticola]|uniref:Uncharacterized protein n=1 Tax=Herminiimonas fonticola TaxID=303380 RepID=A0A4R6GIR8_9BURK|nr:hypothetical protein [Herminiimonas fonticola]RBA25636.1 hypothetical protein Hfont_1269 [Herminiimonas fonticola]TDN94747.1 hypothetical protein EV677_1302 [Herminiimonas fonticola]